MKQVLIRAGEASVNEVPVPQPDAGQILVRVSASCISVGTEMSGVQASDVPLWRKALKHPEKVQQAVNMMVTKGFSQTVAQVRGKLTEPLAVGYSAAGQVVAVGNGVSTFSPGENVAVAGTGYAMHAEFVRVPVNLAVSVPATVSLRDAATVTLGAIAMQGVRRFSPTIGETVVVIGLGLLGQLTVQLLKANGCRVIAIDLDESRVDLARTLGADIAFSASLTVSPDRIARLTDGVGADGVIITAASADSGLLNTSYALCRRKGRVVLVGDIPISMDRSAIYAKELDFYISTSYGPGRYDNKYEEQGLDYPVSYVRWTENRNMSAYLKLVGEKKVIVSPLISKIVPVEEASSAYSELSDEKTRPLAVLLVYPQDDRPIARAVKTNGNWRHIAGAIRVGLSGTSGFAQSVLVPHLKASGKKIEFKAVHSATGHRAKHLAELLRAEYCCTDLKALVSDPDIDLIVIANRHDRHGSSVIEALKAGKHVFTEKPLALTEGDLDTIEDFFRGNPEGGPLLMTGFNRRFSPAIALLLKYLAGRDGPIVATYRMNAGAIPATHWTQSEAGGGRNIGEACHIYDLFTALTQSPVVKVSAAAIGKESEQLRKNENFSASFTFEDGSLCTLVYSSIGAAKWPKETMEIFCDGIGYALDDYRKLIISDDKKKGWEGPQDKGHKAELSALVSAVTGGAFWPMPLWQQVQATRMSFRVEAVIYGQSPEQI